MGRSNSDERRMEGRITEEKRCRMWTQVWIDRKRKIIRQEKKKERREAKQK
jgi:hypothetical protein